jgi:Protein of unknown function (DUF2899).
MPDISEIILDSLIDALRLLPFLFLTYAVMEYMEYKMGEKTKAAIEKSGHFGPVLGAVFGVFPQCGFSAAASGLFAGGMITVGTLVAVFLSTSDEMLPILISEQADIGVILKLLAVKAFIGMTAGFLVDLFVRRKGGTEHFRHMRQKTDTGHVHTDGRPVRGMDIVRPALLHAFQIFLFILLFSFVLNLVIEMAGEDFLAGLILEKPVMGHLIAGLVGLIPNCAASVVITQLYLEGFMSLGVMMSGLLAGSGAGLLVLFRVNDHRKENAGILLLVYVIGVTAGVLLDFGGIAAWL